MKKVYKEPKMKVHAFTCEHILTSSGVTAQASVMNTMAETYSIERDKVIKFSF